jgi:hypothetical protein
MKIETTYLALVVSSIDDMSLSVVNGLYHLNTPCLFLLGLVASWSMSVWCVSGLIQPALPTKIECY